MLNANALLKSGARSSLEINFSYMDAKGVLTHEDEDDLMVIILQMFDWSVKRVLVDPSSSINILYWDAFEGLPSTF